MKHGNERYDSGWQIPDIVLIMAHSGMAGVLITHAKYANK